MRLLLLILLLMWPASSGATEAGLSETPVRIAVLDTGSRIPDRYENVSVRYFDARPSSDSITETGPEYRSEHGTWVTNAILESFEGPVEILSYRVEQSCPEEVRCRIDTTTLKRAALHADSQGAHIIQISSYGRLDPGLEDALAGIAARGVHVVMCAGNEGGISPLIPLARRNPDFIHVVGSLGRGSHRSFFSARDESEDEPLLRWRRGEDVASRTSSGRTTKVTGTSYAASLMTADIARHVSQSRVTTLASATVQQVAVPVQEPEPTTEERIDTRVALAEGGEIAIATLDPVEKARLRSRAIRPDLHYEVSIERPAETAPSSPASPRSTRSRALRPGSD